MSTSGLATLNSAAITNNAAVGGTLAVTGATTTNGITNAGTIANAGAFTQTGATSINTAGAASTVIGNAFNTTSINSATNNMGVNAFATANNIGTNSAAASTNVIGNSNSGTTVASRAGTSYATLNNTQATLGTSTGGSYTAYATPQSTGTGTIGGVVDNKSYTNKISGSTYVDGNLYINGTLDYVSNNSANTSVIGGTAATSNLAGATTATTGGTAIVMKGSTGTQTVVDANGKLTNVTGTATQSTAALTLTNGIGNTHGLVVTETQASLSGGANSSTLTLNDNGANFSNSATGAPVQVHGVNDGTASFDAVNVRQFSSAIASVTAMANIPQVDQDKTYALGVGLGNFMGKTALALGGTYRFTRNGVLKGSVSSAMNSSKSTTVGVGAAWSY